MILTVTANASIDKRAVVKKAVPGAVNRIRECTYSAGGKGLNVSRAVRIAGAEVTATGFLAGHAGRYIAEKLAEENIPADFVWIPGETRSCLNIWDEEKQETTEYLEPGPACTAEDGQKLLDKIRSYTEGSDRAEIITVSGSVPQGCSAGLYREILQIGKDHGIRVLLDTSGKLLEDALKGEAQPFLIKPNLDEIRMLTGRETLRTGEISEAAEVLHRKGIEAVVISLGAEGAVLSCPQGLFRAIVPKVTAVNTVGCGDTMVGGFAVALSRGAGLPEALRFASAVSAAAAMTDRTGFYLLSDMEEMLGRIEIRQIG
ncbi:MAG: 1-phosphofructokinase family hexose kinase [Firmicutes bacterium]|nr:1-phosphofructokinase family hexose kinase [Bacillota bacterium]